jgi:hypothetical protein
MKLAERIMTAAAGALREGRELTGPDGACAEEKSMKDWLTMANSGIRAAPISSLQKDPQSG